MKILRMNFYFLLPENFNGSYNDAIAELIKYREKNELPRNPIDIEGKDVMDDVASEKLWNDFLDTVDNGKRFCGDLSFGAWDEEKKKWVNIIIDNRKVEHD